MSSKYVVVCLAGLIAALALPVYAADGPANLGTAQVGQVDSRWFVDLRVFDTDNNDQDWYDNSTFSLGFNSPINEKTDFTLTYSGYSGSGPDEVNEAIRDSERKVISPVVKRLITGADSKAAVAFSLGADIALSQIKAVNTNSGEEAYQDNFTPAAKLQIEWGKPGATQFQIAGQVAFWDTLCETSVGSPIPGFGTVVAVGGGISKPFGKKLTLVGDCMGLVKGYNVINEEFNTPDNTLVWSAGGNWAFGGASNACLSVYATNSMGPTLGSSIIAAPDDSIALGVALRRDF